jgi:hypothetical protein
LTIKEAADAEESRQETLRADEQASGQEQKAAGEPEP